MAAIGKHRPNRRIDHQPDSPFGSSVGSGEGTGFTAPPAPPTIPAPTGLTLSSALSYSAVTPSARVTASWSGLETYDLEYYVVQISTDSTFATATETYSTAPNQNSIIIDNRRVSTTYYVRVRTVVGDTPSDWSSTANTTTPADTTVPAIPTSEAATFIGTGDLLVTWVNPTSANFRDVEITIYASNGGTLLARAFRADQRYVWTVAQNLAATSGVGDPSLYITLRSRSWSEVYSAAVAVSATKSAPSTPTGLTTSWASDTGTAGADCTISWTTAAADVAEYRLSIDSLTRRIAAPASVFVYTLDANRAQHSGTPDPVLSISLTAYDGLGQSSTAASTTATNAAPAAPTVTLTGGVSVLVAQITSTPAADFEAYEYVFKRDGTTVRTVETRGAQEQYEVGSEADSGTHSWTVVVRQKDAFAQYSSTTTSSAVQLYTLTIGRLRGDVIYRDSIGSTFTPPNSGTLAALKDGTTGSGGVTYNA